MSNRASQLAQRCQRRRLRFDPLVGEENGSPLQHSRLGNPTDRAVWQTAVLGAQRVRHGRVTSSSGGSATPGPVCVGAFLWASAWLPPPPAPCDHMLLRDGIPGRPHLFPLTSLHSPQSGAESGCEIEQTGKKFSEHSRTCSQAARIRPGVEASGDEPGCLLWHLGSASHPDIDAACGRLGGLTWEEPRVMLSQLLEMYQPTSARGPFNGHIPHKDLTFA